MKPERLDKASFLAKTREADHDLFALVKKHHGSISAEHGIGVLKKPYLGYSRSEAEIGVMKGIKRALDPRNILNRGKVLDV
jgi:FAD/FMN-containing dehydrogenase